MSEPLQQQPNPTRCKDDPYQAWMRPLGAGVATTLVSSAAQNIGNLQNLPSMQYPPEPLDSFWLLIVLAIQVLTLIASGIALLRFVTVYHQWFMKQFSCRPAVLILEIPAILVVLAAGWFAPREVVLFRYCELFAGIWWFFRALVGYFMGPKSLEGPDGKSVNPFAGALRSNVFVLAVITVLFALYLPLKSILMNPPVSDAVYWQIVWTVGPLFISGAAAYRLTPWIPLKSGKS